MAQTSQQPGSAHQWDRLHFVVSFRRVALVAAGSGEGPLIQEHRTLVANNTAGRVAWRRARDLTPKLSFWCWKFWSNFLALSTTQKNARTPSRAGPTAG